MLYATPFVAALAGLANSAPIEEKMYDLSAPCAQQPTGYGPVATPDTVKAFLSLKDFASTSNAAATPQGYKVAFTDLNGSVQGTKYLGYKTLQTYSTIQCQQFCDQTNGCKACNIYFERNPTVYPAASCANPSSLTNIKCALWGQNIDDSLATNMGQYQKDFQVVIAGSNGYNKKMDPNSISGFKGPVALGGAINSPLVNGYDTYIGMKFFPDTALTPGLCARYCKQTTQDDHAHPNSDGTYKPCNFFNVWVESKDNKPTGMTCAMYTRAWDQRYAVNVGQYSGNSYVSVSQSYVYTLDPLDSGKV